MNLDLQTKHNEKKSERRPLIGDKQMFYTKERCSLPFIGVGYLTSSRWRLELDIEKRNRLDQRRTNLKLSDEIKKTR